jgi:hypothetical protein
VHAAPSLVGLGALSCRLARRELALGALLFDRFGGGRVDSLVAEIAQVGELFVEG